MPHWTNRGRLNFKDEREALGKAMNEYVEQFVLKLPDESKCDENTDSPEMVIFRLFLVLHIYKFKTRFCICNMEMSSSPCLQM